jgi:hypothetical protein
MSEFIIKAFYLHNLQFKLDLESSLFLKNKLPANMKTEFKKINEFCKNEY